MNNNPSVKAPNEYEKPRLWINWTLMSLAIIPLTYMVSLIVVLLVHGAFGFNQLEGGTYLSQTAMQVAGAMVIGLGVGLYQRYFLNKFFKSGSTWIYTLIIGFAITELITCLFLWLLEINRYELRFIEFNPLPEALIFSLAGLVVGALQYGILKKFFARSGYWIVASSLGWGLCILATLISVYAFFLGALIYGAITGGAIVRMLKFRQT